MLAWLLERERQLIPTWVSTLGMEVKEDDVWEVETQRSIPSGFLDLVLFVPGRSLVIVESKLGSTTDYEQITKYVRYARQEPATRSALVLMTQHPHPWPDGVRQEAEKVPAVELLQRRWQQMADFLAQTDSDLAHEFVAMLEGEKLAMPRPITVADLAAWSKGDHVRKRLERLLKEAELPMRQLEPNWQNSGAVRLASNGLIYRLVHFQRLSVGLAFWPADDTEGKGLVVGYVLNTQLPLDQQRAASKAAVARAANPMVRLSGWSEGYVQRNADAATVLGHSDFTDQVANLVDYVRDTIAYFRSIDYLSPADTLG